MLATGPLIPRCARDRRRQGAPASNPAKRRIVELTAEFGGEGEIRTHEPRKGLPVFKTGAFNRSATSPNNKISHLHGNFTLTEPRAATANH